MYPENNGILQEVSEKLYGVREYRGYIAACCPFHEDENPSLLVNPTFWRCLACGARGKTESLLDILSRIPKPVEGRKRKAVNRLTYLINEFGINGLLRYVSTPSYYMLKRGIDEKHQREVGVGTVEGMVIFPVKNNFGEVSGIVGRYVDEGVKPKYIVPAGQKPMLFSPDWRAVLSASKVFVVWGMVDALTLFVLGFPVVTPTSGVGASPTLFDWLRKTLILVPDRGEEAQVTKVCSYLGWRGKMVRPPYPEGAKDVNDFYRISPESLYSFVREAYHE